MNSSQNIIDFINGIKPAVSEFDSFNLTAYMLARASDDSVFGFGPLYNRKLGGIYKLSDHYSINSVNVKIFSLELQKAIIDMQIETRLKYPNTTVPTLSECNLNELKFKVGEKVNLTTNLYQYKKIIKTEKVNKVKEILKILNELNNLVITSRAQFVNMLSIRNNLLLNTEHVETFVSNADIKTDIFHKMKRLCELYDLKVNGIAYPESKPGEMGQFLSNIAINVSNIAIQRGSGGYKIAEQLKFDSYEDLVKISEDFLGNLEGLRRLEINCNKFNVFSENIRYRINANRMAYKVVSEYVFELVKSRINSL
jgi:hypothetical protein